MKSRQLLIIAGLLLLVLAAIAGLMLTRESAQPALSKASKKSVKPPPVDEKPLQTARSLAPSAATPQERRFAQEAERVSDHEVDLAFAQALRDAGNKVDQASPQNRELFDRLSKAEAGVAKDQARLDELKNKSTRQLETARTTSNNSLSYCRYRWNLTEMKSAM